MHKLVLLTLVLISVHSYTFQDYILEFNRNYTPEEREARKTTFEKNMEIIQETNSKDLSYKLGPTKWTDRFENETQKSTNTDQTISFTDQLQIHSNNILREQNSQIPDEVDWRSKNIITPIKDQKACPTGWAFAATASIQSLFLSKSNIYYDLSEEYLFQCAYEFNSCYFFSPNSPYIFLKQKNGMPLQCQYPYKVAQTPGICQTKDLKKLISNTSFEVFNDVTLDNMKSYLKQTPISAMIYASTKFLQYKNGIYKCSESDMKIQAANHVVQIIGYNSIKNYYIIKNSWGTDWGVNGFGYVDMTYNCKLDSKVFIVGRNTQNEFRTDNNKNCGENSSQPPLPQPQQPGEYRIYSGLLQISLYLTTICLSLVFL